MDARPALLRLRLRGKITDPGDPDAAALVERAHATPRAGQLVLTPAGRAEADSVFLVRDDVVRDAYEQFLPRNAELLRVCHDWQVRGSGGPNDHRDATYDWGVIDRLGAIDERVGPVVRRLGRKVTVFDGYRERLRNARRQVEDGGREWFTSPRIDSYHTVWMELHEHLLVALGLERGAESTET